MTSLLAAFALFAGCGGDSGGGATGDGGGPPVDGGTVVIAEAGDLNQPLAIISEGGLGSNLQDVLYMTLLRGAWRDGRLVYLAADESPMALARSYEYTGADSASLRYHMRSDARWSDGEPITAADVAFTYEMLRNPAVASPRQDYTENIQSIEVEDDSTVVFHFQRRYPEMRFHSGHGIIPRHIYVDVPPENIRTHNSVLEPANGNLVVSGAYLIGSWTRGQQVVLERNPHFAPRGHLDRIVFRIIPEMTTRLVELQTGSVDWVQAVSFDQIPGLKLQRAQTFRFEREEKRFYDYVAYNPTEFPAFADVNVRRALGLAINVPGLLAALQMADYAVPASGPYPPIFADLYDPEAMPPLKHNPAEAKRLLTAAGWTDSDGDGIIDRDGVPFRFTLITNTGNQRRADVSQILQRQWRDIGVDATLRSIEFTTFMQMLTTHDFQAAVGGWGVGLSADLTGMWGLGSPFNIVSYSNPDAQDLFRQALSQPTDEAAAPHWRAAAAQVIEDQPYTWLYYMDQVDVINDRVKDTVVNTFGPYQNAWDWWIPLDGRRQAGPAAASSQ